MSIRAASAVRPAQPRAAFTPALPPPAKPLLSAGPSSRAPVAFRVEPLPIAVYGRARLEAPRAPVARSVQAGRQLARNATCCSSLAAPLLAARVCPEAAGGLVCFDGQAPGRGLEVAAVVDQRERDGVATGVPVVVVYAGEGGMHDEECRL
jgi:hypothetical protein